MTATKSSFAMSRRSLALHIGLLVAGVVAPILFPGHIIQFAIFWIFVLFALTWDIMGGQMGYNSLGNILFFGLGMYICAVTQIAVVYDVAQYTAASGAKSTSRRTSTSRACRSGWCWPRSARSSWRRV